MKPGPPGYVWDSGRYRILRPDGRPGERVSQQSIVENLRSMHEAEAELFQDVMRGYYNDEIDLGIVQYAIQTELKNLHLAMAALAVGGWQNVDSGVNQRTASALRREYQYLAALLLTIRAQNITQENAIDRMALYADGGFGRYWDETDLQQRRFGFSRERVIIYPKACTICIAAAAAGWVPIGTYRIPIHLSCRCEKEYS